MWLRLHRVCEEKEVKVKKEVAAATMKDECVHGNGVPRIDEPG